MGSIPCANCGTQVNAEAIGCPNCGADPETGVVPEPVKMAAPVPWPWTPAGRQTRRASVAGTAVTVYRERVAWGGGSRLYSFGVHLDGEQIGEIDNGGWLCVPLTPGPHTLAVRFPRGTETLEFDAQPGSDLVFECGWNCSSVDPVAAAGGAAFGGFFGIRQILDPQGAHPQKPSGTIQCPSCAQDITVDAVACCHCGWQPSGDDSPAEVGTGRTAGSADDGVCPACHSRCREGAKFCGECGVALTLPPSAAQRVELASPAPPAELSVQAVDEPSAPPEPPQAPLAP